MKLMILILFLSPGLALAKKSSTESHRKEIVLDKSLLDMFATSDSKIPPLNTTGENTVGSFSYDFSSNTSTISIKEGRRNPFQQIDGNRERFSEETFLLGQ